MELKHCLKQNIWEICEASKVQGLRSYSVIRQEVLGQGEFQYAVRLLTDQDAEHCSTMSVVKVIGSASDSTGPLHKVNNCELRIVDNTKVTAINLDGDCAVMRE